MAGQWPRTDLLTRRRQATPDRTAVVDVSAGREWTYRAFDAIVDGVTARLQSLLATDTRDRVAMLASPRVGFFAALHAVMRDGHAVVPLDTRLSGDQLRSRLDSVDPALLVCERSTETTALSAADCPVASLDAPEADSVDALQPAGPAESAEVEPARWERGDTAVVLFTSGTTDEPKGVRLTLGNLVASATGSAFRLGTSPGDRWLCCLPVFHMGGLAPGLRCPLSGTTLLVQQGFDVTSTADALATHSATGVSLVPTMLKRLLDGGWTPAESLQTVLLGGAPADEALLDRAREAGVPVWPTYGMTETASQIATATPAQAAEFSGTVGQPLVTTDVTILDAAGDPVAAGETGEVVVDGPTVTPGYLDDATTVQAVGEAGLHTGDVGYRDEDGRLWILGRLDDAIITGGENVHPRRVADVLTDHDSVEAAAVVGLPDAEWGERIGALVVTEATPAAVEAFARERLADHEIPKVVATTETLPRTASGTVDRETVRDHLLKQE